MPSTSEFGELVGKADQKVAMFEQAVKIAKPHLDNANPKLSANYLDGASTAHDIIKAIQKNGPSAYALVLLITTLDDLSLDAAKGSLTLLIVDEGRVAKGQSPDSGAQTSVLSLSNAGDGCTDIAELLMHATARFIQAEEEILGKLLPEEKTK
jgi:hypothetical protein